MGQQQLLLLVLGIVIVGLAVVVGIQAFGENQKKANADAITNDVIRIASDAQAWALKPTAFGGGNGAFTGVTLEKLGYETTGSGTAAVYANLNADASSSGANSGYKLGTVTAPTGPIPTGAFTITGCNASRGNKVVSTINGTGPTNITTVVSNVTACP